MNQVELNRVAMDAIYEHGSEVFSKLQVALVRDSHERSKHISGMALHHVHNIALYECLIWLNSIIAFKDTPENASLEYLSLAKTLEPKFMEIVNALKDFQPANDSGSN
jgi:hypothetical protein